MVEDLKHANCLATMRVVPIKMYSRFSQALASELEDPFGDKRLSVTHILIN